MKALLKFANGKQKMIDLYEPFPPVLIWPVMREKNYPDFSEAGDALLSATHLYRIRDCSELIYDEKGEK